MKKVRFVGVYARNGYRWTCWEFWQHILRLPIYMWRELRDFYLRGMYGYANSDLWSLDCYLSSWMPNALEDMKNHPMGCALEDGDMDTIIDAFVTSNEIDEMVGLFDENDKLVKDHAKVIKKQHKRMEKGFAAMGKNFKSLWT